MGYDKRTLDEIYHKTGGYCHLCRRKVYRTNYGLTGRRGAWHVEHSVALASGGTNYFRNLFPACIPCNLEKGTRSGKAFRASLDRQSGGELGLGDLVVLGLGALALASLLSGPKQEDSPGSWNRPPGYP